MHSITLVFDLDSIDTEDAEIKDYLRDNQLSPRNTYTDVYEDKNNCHVMEFGGCYLGRHLEAIAFIQRDCVEVELLTNFLEENVEFDQYLIPKNQMITHLVSRLRTKDSFVVKNDELCVSLSKLDVDREIKEIV